MDEDTADYEVVDTADNHKKLEEKIAEDIAGDNELNALKARHAEILTELAQLNPGFNPSAQPNPWPTLLRMLFDMPGAPLEGYRLQFERQVWRELVDNMEAELPQAREMMARMRLMGGAPGPAPVPPGSLPGKHQRLGVVHDGRATRRG